jgi:uncharacterized DUF497 family protein
LNIVGLIWLEEIVEKLARKHQVNAQEVRETLTGNPSFRFIEKGERPGDNVYAASGQSDAGRYLIIFFVYKSDRRALILSARDMTPAERRRYGRE